MSWPIPPGHVSMHRARALLGRCAGTLDQFCLDLGIEWHGRNPGRHLGPAEFRRLRDHCEAHPKSYRSQRMSTGICVELDPERRRGRDREIAQRIEAASRWKRRHFGAEIESEEIIEMELNT